MSKIYSIDLSIEKLELKTPFKTALRQTDVVEFVRVSINGGEAFGEAPATKAITGEDLRSIKRDIDSIKEHFIGKSAKMALSELKLFKIGSSAKAALDIAFTYLDAKKYTLKNYFNISDESAINTDITISLNDTKKMLEDSIKAYNDGCEILKVKVGSDIKSSIEIIKKIAQNLPKAKILVDANQAWSVEDSISFIDGISGTAIELIEQPVVASNIDGLKKITSYSNIKVVADEAVFNLDDVKKVMQSGSANIINIKLMKCGGVSSAIEILEYAKKHNFKCMLGSMLEGPYSINIALYLAFAYRDVIAYVDLDSPLLYKQLPQELDFEFSGSKITLKL